MENEKNEGNPSKNEPTKMLVDLQQLKLYKEAWLKLKQIADHVQKEGQLVLKNDLSMTNLKALMRHGKEAGL
jgi:hypothetical protein